jgi:hypothetical protein
MANRMTMAIISSYNIKISTHLKRVLALEAEAIKKIKSLAM